MILDALLQFSTAQAITASADSTNVIDLGVGQPGNPQIPGFAGGGGARDMGIGDDPALKILVLVGTAFATLTSLAVTMQGAPDNGSGSPGAFTIMATGPAVAVANLVSGARIFEIDMPRPAPGQPIPRFLKLNYAVTGSNATAGTVNAYLVVDRDDQPKDALGVYGGYPAGVTVAN